MKPVSFIILAFFLVSMISSGGQACSCNFELLNEVIKNPKTANSSFIAVFKNGYFEVKKNWKPVPSIKFKTTSSWPGHVTKCDLTLEDSNEYLIISTQRTEAPMALDRCAVSAIKLDEAHDLLAKLDGPLPSEPQSDSPITSHYQDPAEKIYGTKFEINEKWTGTISEFCEKNLSKSFAIGGLTCKDTEVKFDKSYGSYSVKPCGEALQSKYVMWKAIFCGDR